MENNAESDLFILGHIIDCIDRIIFLVNSCKTVEIFKNKWIEQDAMLRNFEIIGEAANHISDETKAHYPTIEWYKIRGMRNFISHEYFGMKLETIWYTAIQSIPLLKTQIAQIMADLEAK